MHCPFLLKSVAWLLTLFGAAYCLSAYTIGIDPNTAYGIGLDYSYSKRKGFYDFPTIKKSQLVARSDLNMLGVTVGKRWMINKYCRFQAGIGYEAGSAVDDTLLLNTPGLVKYSFYHISADPLLQLPLLFSGRTRPFLLLGGGVNYTITRKRTFALDKSIEFIYSDLPWIYVRSGYFSLHAAAGFGLDYALTRSAMIGIWYAFRYWQPVRYEIEEDFPLSAQKYHETFFSHNFHLTLLFDVR
jgi:hypothetical protein